MFQNRSSSGLKATWNAGGECPNTENQPWRRRDLNLTYRFHFCVLNHTDSYSTDGHCTASRFENQHQRSNRPIRRWSRGKQTPINSRGGRGLRERRGGVRGDAPSVRRRSAWSPSPVLHSTKVGGGVYIDTGLKSHILKTSCPVHG